MKNYYVRGLSWYFITLWGSQLELAVGQRIFYKGDIFEHPEEAFISQIDTSLGNKTSLTHFQIIQGKINDLPMVIPLSFSKNKQLYHHIQVKQCVT